MKTWKTGETGKTRKTRKLPWSRVLLCLSCLTLFASCALPQWRIFQKKVDGKLAETPSAQLEGERQAASYIAQRSAPLPVSQAAAPVSQLSTLNSQLSDIHSVATGLSASLGEPEKIITLEDKDAIITSLRTGLRAKEEQLDKWKAFGKKYAGTPLVDTGLNLAGPAGVLVLVAIIALCIACPTLPWLLLRVLPRLWGCLSRTSGAIGEFIAAHPEGSAALKARLSSGMDEAHKSLIRLFRRRASSPAP